MRGGASSYCSAALARFAGGMEAFREFQNQKREAYGEFVSAGKRAASGHNGAKAHERVPSPLMHA